MGRQQKTSQTKSLAKSLIWLGICSFSLIGNCTLRGYTTTPKRTEIAACSNVQSKDLLGVDQGKSALSQIFKSEILVTTTYCQALHRFCIYKNWALSTLKTQA